MTKDPRIHRFSHQAMGTFFEAVLAGADELYAGQAAAAAFREIDRIEILFSRFDPSSEISRISRMKPAESALIGVETFECLTVAEKVRAESGGAFDVYFRRGGLSSRTADFLRLDRAPSGFRVERPLESDQGPLDIDLGAIGKGYAVDLALAVLGDWGIDRALVHGGTSTAAALGAPPDSNLAAGGWPVGVGSGWPSAGVPNRVLLKNRALSGSGTEIKGDHIMDPETGLPGRGHLAAWASHPSAAESDALSTAFFVMSTDAVEKYCRSHPQTWAMVILEDETCRIFNSKLLPAA